jgi:hypothetical protein
MGFTGNLKTLSFGDILQLIATGKKTGLLRLNRPHGAKLIWFRDGNVVAAASESAVEEERLGQVLLRQGLIREEDLKRALKRQSANGKRLGHVLIEMGLLERGAIVDALRAQVEESVYNVFSIAEGEFQFTDGESPDKGQILVELNSLNVMMEGARRFDEFMEIAHALPTGETVLRMTPSPRLETPEITLTTEDVDVLSAIDGARTVAEVIGLAANGEYAASKSLHKLVKSNLVEKCPDAVERVNRRVEETQLYDLIFRLYSHSLQTIHKSMVEYFGALGGRLFFAMPERCDEDVRVLVGVLTAGSGGTEESFRQEIGRVSDAIRLHRVLELANSLLSDKVQALQDRLGPHTTAVIIGGIQKEVAFVLAQKRILADKYDIARDFRRALQGVE